MGAAPVSHADAPGESDLESWIRLASITGVSSTSQRTLLTAFGSPAASLRARRADVAAVLDRRATDAWSKGPDADLVARGIEWLSVPGNTLITLADTSYPRALLNTPDPPPILYAKGRIELLTHDGLAVVGARSAT